MSKTNTLSLSEGSAEKLKAWQKQFHADATPPSQETKRERKNRLSRLARRRRIDTGVLLQRPRKSAATKELIMANVDIDSNSGCWIWKGGRDKDGYGKLRHLGKDDRVNRISWELWSGLTIPQDLKCLHHCDNPPCCNPEHLFLGTSGDNIIDAAKKERMRYKLKFEQVEMIRSDSRSLNEIAVDYGITPGWVSQIKNKPKRLVVPNRLL